jgi:hypothetical protein
VGGEAPVTPVLSLDSSYLNPSYKPCDNRGQTVMVRVVQGQHGDLRQRLAWDPGIARLIISLTDRGEWTFAGESCFDFPLSFIVGESTSLEDVSWRSLQYLILASTGVVDGGRVDLGSRLEDGLIP